MTPSSNAQGKKMGDNWRDRATTWQTSNAMANRTSWFNPEGRKPSKPVWCYNCGDQGDHYSTACSKARKDPATVVLARLGVAPGAPSPLSTVTGSSSGTPEGGAAGGETAVPAGKD